MLLELTLYMTYFQQACLNRFNYIMTGTPAAVSPTFALTYAAGFVKDGTPPAYDNDLLFGQIRLNLSTAVAFNEVRTINVYNDTDFYTLPFIGGEAGFVGGTPVSPTVALGFRSNQVNRSIRRGFKRFVGVSENIVTSGGALDGDGITWATALASALGEVLTYDDEGNTLTFTPCVVSKEKYVAPSGNDAYRYYSTYEAQLARTAIGVDWQHYNETRTQRSRQYGN